jgi:hypothetical protein
MASMAEPGGYLICGVKEDKARHDFTVDEMPQVGCGFAPGQNSLHVGCCASFCAASEPSFCWRGHRLAKTDSRKFRRRKETEGKPR